MGVMVYSYAKFFVDERGQRVMVFKWQKNKKIKRSSAPLTPWEQEQKRRQERLKAKKKKIELRPEYDRNLPKMKKKRTQRLKKHEKVLLSVFLTLTLITFYFILPFSRVMSVKIDSSYPESKNEILEASDLRYYESLFGVWPRTEQISQKIKKNVSSVKSVDISYKGSKITIKAQEYPMVGYLKKGSAYYRITSVGSVSSEKLKRITGKYPVFYSFDSKKPLVQTAQQFSKLSPEIRQSISEIHAAPTKVDPQRIKLYMNDGNQVIAKSITLKKKMKYYPNISANMDSPGIVDLEVGAFSYPYGKK